MNKLRLVLACFLAGLIISCEKENYQKVNPETHYAYDGIVQVNQTNVFGFGVVPKNDLEEYSITVKKSYPTDSRKIKYIKFRTGHRSIALSSLGVREYTYKFIPNQDVERGVAVDLKIDIVLDDSTLVQSQLVFENKFFSGDGLLRCNSVNLRLKGNAVCQGEVGTTQMIIPDHPGEMESKCNFTQFGNAYKLKLEEGNCVYVIKSKSGSWIRLVTYGYNDRILGML